MGQYYYVPDPGEQRGGYPAPMFDRMAHFRQNQTAPVSPLPPQPPENGGIIWVQGEAGAKAYSVAPGTTIQLWDSEDQVIYLKSADISGMPSMRVLEYTERSAAQAAKQQAPQLDMNQIVTWDKLENYLTDRIRQALKSEKEEAGNG